MRVLMLVWSNVALDARVLREATTLADDGHQVHIVGRAVPADFAPPAGVSVSSVGRPPASGTAAPRQRPLWQRVVRWLLLPEYVGRRLRGWQRGAYADAAARDFDVVHAHDFTALPPGARLAGERGVPLVYDSHELWSGLGRAGRPTPLRRRRELAAERRLGARAAVVITVSDGVADRLRSDLGFRDVRVVRNSFPAMTPAALPPGGARGAVYAGRLAPDRDLEVLTAAARLVPDLPVTLIGPADETWLAGFDSTGVTVLPPRPADELDVLLRAAGIALITLSGGSANHQVALPNKLFHAVRAGVPVVASDVPEVARTVRRLGLGALYRPGDADSLAAALRTVARDHARFAANTRDAIPAMSWSHDAEVLRAAYATLEVG